MTPANLVSQWMLPGIGLAFFAAVAWANAGIVFGWPRQVRAARAAGSHVSMIPGIAGVIGALAMWHAPAAWMRDLFWLPLLLDVGSLPYAVLLLMALRAGTAVDAAAAPVADAAARQRRDDEAARPYVGCLLGTAVGDALGLPAEGLSPQRQARLFPATGRYHFLPFGRGMCSDDTEHAIMVAQALTETAGQARAAGDAEAFRRNLAWRLRWWLLGLPAGIGMATLKGVVKLWLFLPRRWQGVWSAGNAPAMRSALIGLFWADRPELLQAHVTASTQLTHTDPKAAQAALAVALAAAAAARDGAAVVAADYAAALRTRLGPDGAELAALVDRVAASVRSGESSVDFARGLGLETGVTGYALHTVPVALHAWLSHPGDFRAAVLAAIHCGGDSDTVAAITGAIAGAGVGREGIPPQWLERLAEWPHDVVWMESLARSLAAVRRDGVGSAAAAAPAWQVLARNLLFFAVVLVHGFRRLLPPY